MKENKLTHTDEYGAARMVDVSEKPKVKRRAIACGSITVSHDVQRLIKENALAKGDVLAAARIAGIMAAKRTSELIPLCHQVNIDKADIAFTFASDAIHIQATLLCQDRTGIEMEALTAVALAALTIYDMCKAVDKSMEIRNIQLLEKTKEEQ